MPTRALTVAVAASVLLVALVAADAAMNRAYHLEARLGGEWVRVASLPEARLREAPAISLFPFDLNASDTVTFRIRAHNGHPWPMQSFAEVTISGRHAFSGLLEAGAFQDAEVTFDVPAAQLMEDGVAWGPERAAPGAQGRPWHPSLVLRVGGDLAHASLAIREVAR